MFDFIKKYEPRELEEKVIEFWKTNNIFEKSLKKKGPVFRFYEGPPTANGLPGIHHVLARVFKDIILRYKTMRGFLVYRRAGWDTHGLPVEVGVEKALGLKSKKDIENYGIAAFNKKAKESVWRYKEEWEKLTNRIGFWLDFKNAYVIYENKYIESLWWIFKNVSERGYLKKSYKVLPYCARCATPLASHELAQPGVYKKTKDPSVYIKLEVMRPFFAKASKGKQEKIREFFLVWTTTPWTLPANVAIAVNTTLTYTKFKVTEKDGSEEFLWSYNPPPNLDGVEIEAVEKISGKKLVGLKYEPIFKNIWQTKSKIAFSVFSGDFVETGEGTGLVHIAPSFGEDDFRLIESVDKKLIEEMPITVDDNGVLLGDLPGSGKFVKEADKDIVQDLTNRGVLYQTAVYEHEYPFCWRCNNPLIYFAKNSWFFEVSRMRKDLAKLNQKINWVPGHLKDGRFGEWLKEAKDWAISRSRYWGTPLPIWECEKCDNKIVVGSLDELKKYSFSRNNFWIVRHMESDHNVNDWLATGPEESHKVSKPTEKGLEEARKIAKSLRAKKIDSIYTSSFFRTKNLAGMIARECGAKVIQDIRLNEIDCGIFNGGSMDNYRNFFNSQIERFYKVPEGGETLNGVRARILTAVFDINKKNEGKNILIVSHGDPLWLLEAGLKNLTNEETLDLAKNYIKYGEVREIKVPNFPVDQEGNLDLHRPYVDEIKLGCLKCKNKMIRVKDVADVWFDSGGMPYASIHYPFENRDLIDKNKFFPADYICEGLDQTRGWFYTMLVVSALLDKGIPYHNVLTMGLVLDKYGQKMSKSKGNVIEPWEMFNKYGVDAIRWYFYTVNPPSEPKRFDEVEVQKTFRRFLMILYNSFIFFKTYGFELDYRQGIADHNNLHVLDKWILARLHRAIQFITENLEKYEIGEAAKAVEVLVDDLSKWYIRRSRRRFQKPENEKELRIVSSVLGYVLLEISKLIAPFTPFFAEGMYKELNPKFKESVHLDDWPKLDKTKIQEDLLEQMVYIRKLAGDGLALRAKLGIKVRQPLPKFKIKSLKLKIKEDLLEILKEEINVKEIEFDINIKDEIEFDINITPELKAEGLRRELIRIIQYLRQEANYKPKDRMVLGMNPILGDFNLVLKEVGAEKLEENKKGVWDAQIETKIEGQEIWIGIRRA